MILDGDLLKSNKFRAASCAILGNEEMLEKNFHLLANGSDSFALKRKYEFVAGRICAKKVLTELGHSDFILKSGDKRQPIWPKGIVGSITHNKYFAICVASKQLRCLGVDIEEIIDNERLEKLQSQFVSKEEEVLNITPEIGTLIFSTKEALFKALFPIVQEFFGFMDAQVVEITKNEVTVKLLRSDGEFKQFQKPISCKYKVFNNNIISLIQIP